MTRHSIHHNVCSQTEPGKLTLPLLRSQILLCDPLAVVVIDCTLDDLGDSLFCKMLCSLVRATLASFEKAGDSLGVGKVWLNIAAFYDRMGQNDRGLPLQ